MTVASPAYLARHGTPRDPAALNRHGLLSVSDGVSRTWEFTDVDGIYRVSTGSALSATSSAMVRVAALNHMGIALLPLPIIADDLAQGMLVPVLEQFEINGGPRQTSILYSGRNYLSMRVLQFHRLRRVSQYRAAPDPRRVAQLTPAAAELAALIMPPEEQPDDPRRRMRLVIACTNIVRTLSSMQGCSTSTCAAHWPRQGMAKVMATDYDVYVTLDRMLARSRRLLTIVANRCVAFDAWKPVLVMSAMSDVDQRIQGLRAGGDDYLTKPFSPEEMFARVEVLLRRRPRHAKAETLLRAGALELDLVRRKVTHRQRELDLQPTEFRVLEFMMRHAGQVLTRTMIFEAVWGCRFDPGTNLIDVHIGRLRKKVERPGERPLIRTIRGSGYLLG